MNDLYDTLKDLGGLVPQDFSFPWLVPLALGLIAIAVLLWIIQGRAEQAKAIGAASAPVKADLYKVTLFDSGEPVQSWQTEDWSMGEPELWFTPLGKTEEVVICGTFILESVQRVNDPGDPIFRVRLISGGKTVGEWKAADYEVGDDSEVDIYLTDGRHIVVCGTYVAEALSG